MSKLWFDTPLGKSIQNRQDPAEKPRHSAPARTFGSRMYASARSSRLTAGWSGANSSADSELVSSLTVLRSRSRSLVRDSSYAKRARLLVVNNVIGTGIGLQAQVRTTRDELNRRVNEDIESAWSEWCCADSCHTGGRLGFAMLERALMAQVFEAGEVFVRKHYRAFGDSRIPFALELIEAERIADDLQVPGLSPASGNILRMGIEMDRFYRPIAYYIRNRHPSEVRWTGDAYDQVERVPADQIIHLAVVDRWPQTRGEPWMHAVARRLNDMDGYSEAELIRARSQAVRMGIIETPDDASTFGEEQDDGSVEMELEPGTIQRLNPGEKWHDSAPTAPNPQLDPFMRYMLREVAAGCGPSYESLSRDYSQSNYSSSRLALLDDRDLWRVYQSWFISDFRQKVHREWLRAAVLSRAIASISAEQYATDQKRFECVRYKPRGWSWIDPTKEVDAYKEAIKAGLTTVTDVIAATAGGQDIEDVLDTRKRELELMEERELVFDTDPEIYGADAKAAEAPPGQPPAVDPPEPPDPAEDPEEDPPARVFSFPRK